MIRVLSLIVGLLSLVAAGCSGSDKPSGDLPAGAKAGSFAGDDCYGFGGCTDGGAREDLEADEVWCRWQTTHVEVHMVLNNGFSSDVQVNVTPRYEITDGGIHGTSLGSDVAIGVAGGDTVEVLIDAGEPEDVSTGAEFESCEPRLHDIALAGDASAIADNDVEVTAAGASDETTTGEQSTSSPPAALNATDLRSDGRFWLDRTEQEKQRLAALCRKDAAQEAKRNFHSGEEIRAIRVMNPGLLAKKLDGNYEPEYNRDESIQEACNDAVIDVLSDIEDAKAEAEAKRQAAQEAMAKRKLRNFKATNELVRVLVDFTLGPKVYRGNTGPDDYIARVRSVDCRGRASCTVAYTDDLYGGFGRDKTPEEIEELERASLDRMAKVFKGLFRDPRLQEATLTPYTAVLTPGGKSKIAPMMRMRCTREAANQINWDDIALFRPDGFKAAV